MQPGTQPPAGPLYGMSRDKLQVLKKYLEDNLSKGFIWASSPDAAAHVLFLSRSLEEVFGSVWTTVASILLLSRTNTPCH